MQAGPTTLGGLEPRGQLSKASPNMLEPRSIPEDPHYPVPPTLLDPPIQEVYPKTGRRYQAVGILPDKFP